jgi:(p)ppGpp synthase/HD superfamily hydrolase
MFSDKTYAEARMVAERCHGHQPYDDIFPYTKHLDDVVGVLKRFGYSGKFIVAGYLHDAIEDGNISYNDIKKHFGEEVAEMVFCVTDELGRNRKERKTKTLAKTATNPDAIVLKLADRIANIEHGGKVGMYLKEHEGFRGALFTPGHAEDMWYRLEVLLYKKR